MRVDIYKIIFPVWANQSIRIMTGAHPSHGPSLNTLRMLWDSFWMKAVFLNLRPIHFLKAPFPAALLSCRLGCLSSWNVETSFSYPVFTALLLILLLYEPWRQFTGDYLGTLVMCLVSSVFFENFNVAVLGFFWVAHLSTTCEVFCLIKFSKNGITTLFIKFECKESVRSIAKPKVTLRA